MTLVDILLTIGIQVLFCLGLRQLLSDGMILHFIRKPFENKKRLTSFASFVLKPFILCVVCFSSVWGGSVFIALHGFLPIPLIISCVSTAFIIRVINDKMDW